MDDNYLIKNNKNNIYLIIIKCINKKRCNGNSNKNITSFKIKMIIIFISFFIINHIRLFS